MKVFINLINNYAHGSANRRVPLAHQFVKCLNDSSRTPHRCTDVGTRYLYLCLVETDQNVTMFLSLFFSDDNARAFSFQDINLNE